jgi:hypothetical protein
VMAAWRRSVGEHLAIIDKAAGVRGSPTITRRNCKPCFPKPWRRCNAVYDVETNCEFMI